MTVAKTNVATKGEDMLESAITYCEETGMPYCNECDERLRTNDDASTLCLIDDADCPMRKYRGK